MAMDSMAPTRMNLLKLKGQIKMASDGAGLLKGKRDALMQELITRAKELRDMRNALHERGRVAETAMAMAQAVRGSHELKSAALAGRRDMRIMVKSEKVWGLALGDIDIKDFVREATDRGMGMLDTSSHVLEAAESAEVMVEQLLRCAPLERNLQVIGEEVKKVSRRINAIEEYLLPNLRAQMRQIASVLDEREREDTFRLKKIKAKKAQQKAAKAKAEAAAAHEPKAAGKATAEASRTAEPEPESADSDPKAKSKSKAKTKAKSKAKRKPSS